MSHGERTKHIFFLVLVTSLNKYGLSKEARTNFRATEDFVFQSILRPDILYNPEYITIAKRIDLKPLARAVIAVRELIASYNATCLNWKDEEMQSTDQRRYVRLPGKSITVRQDIEI